MTRLGCPSETTTGCSCSSDSATNESACTGGPADPWAGVGTLGTDALGAGDPAGESVLNASAVSTAVSAVVEVVVLVVLLLLLLLLLLMLLLLLLLLLSQPNLLLSASLLADLLDLVFLTTSVLDLLLLLFEFGYLGMISVTL